MKAALAVEVRPLGRSPLQVPRVMLGCGNYGGVGSAHELFGAGLDEAQAFAVMDAAWELGLTHFDTADAYGGGRSEATIGRWMRERGVRPLLTTKTFNPMSAGADHGLAPERIERQLHSSLERLGVDHVDLYLAHDFDPDVPLEETLGTMMGLVQRGLVGACGVSNFDARQLALALGAGRVDCVQNSHSLLDRVDGHELLDLCAAERVAYTAFSPLAGGWLTGKYRRDRPYPGGSRMTLRPDPYRHLETGAVFDALDVLRAGAGERGVSMAGLALAWLLADPRVTAVVVGPNTPDQLAPVREALEQPLSPAERDELAAAF